MEFYVCGEIRKDKLPNEEQFKTLAGEIRPLGYKADIIGDTIFFEKPGKIESVISELLPVCESYGFDVEDCNLSEYTWNNEPRSRYVDGRIIRE